MIALLLTLTLTLSLCPTPCHAIQEQQPVKDLPDFPLDVLAFMGDTQHLSNEEVGAYLRLLMHQWVNGSIPDDPKRAAQIVGTTRTKFLNRFSIVFELFLREKTTQVCVRKQPRLEATRKAQRERLKAVSAQRKQAVAARWEKERGKSDRYGPYPSRNTAEIPLTLTPSLTQGERDKTPPKPPSSASVDVPPADSPLRARGTPVEGMMDWFDSVLWPATGRRGNRVTAERLCLGACQAVGLRQVQAKWDAYAAQKAKTGEMLHTAEGWFKADGHRGEYDPDAKPTGHRTKGPRTTAGRHESQVKLDPSKSWSNQS